MIRTFSVSMFGPRDPSHKYVDLILAVSSKWANFDPPKSIEVCVSIKLQLLIFTSIYRQVGDYGTINRDTGQFEKEGNIYRDKTTAQLVSEYPPKEACKEEIMVVASDTVTQHELSLKADL
jgi:hypothetical protein